METSLAQDPCLRPPRPIGCPLFAHRCGQWAKKIRGRTRYFGPWKNLDLALRRWEAQKADLLAGREPQPIGPDELLLHELCNTFLASKKLLLEQADIGPRSWDDYLATCQRMVRVLGRGTAVSHLVPEDFSRLRSDMAKSWGPTRIGNEVRRVRMVFTYGVKRSLMERVPNFGDGLRRPSAKTLRKHRSDKGPRMFEAEQLRQILERARPTLKAMILLAINCGFGNHDVATIQRKHLDRKTAWVNYPRPKTGIARRAKLWPETLRALRKMLRLRDRRIKVGQAVDQPVNQPVEPIGPQPQPATSAQPQSELPETRAATTSEKRRYKKLLFLTRGRRPWTSKSGSKISQEFGRLLHKIGLHRPGLNFYALRHTFETIAGATKDQPAVSAVMGHAAKSDDMSAVYRERIDDDRLAAVSEHVRQWLFGKEAKKQN